jgi:pimeloyl-ACP methyl ester carboxylesterase
MLILNRSAALIAVVSVNCFFLVSRTMGQSSDIDRLVDVGGYRLHLKCSGVGSPTVVLEAGLGGSSGGWVKVMPEIAKFTRVCGYDRPNQGSSDAAPRPTTRIGSRTFIALRTGQDIVHDLHTLLSNSGERGPYVMVGHSLGGMYAILYASAYPKDVVGMVLEDSSHPDQVMQKAKITGPEIAERAHESLIQNEEGADVDTILAEAKATQWHSDIPLYVLSRGPEKNPTNGVMQEQWDRLQETHRKDQQDLASRSTNSTSVVAEKSGHFIHRDQPDIVINAIQNVVEMARRNAGGLSK